MERDPVVDRLFDQSERSQSAQERIEVARLVAEAIRAATYEPPMLDGQLVPRERAAHAVEALRPLLIATLDRVATESARMAQRFAVSWHWCEPVAAVVDRYPLDLAEGASLTWPTPPTIGRWDVLRIAWREYRWRVARVVWCLDAYRGSEPDRVRVAALRWSAGDIERLAKALFIAVHDDWRTLLMAAEYPGYTLSAARGQAAIDADYAAYLAWLRS